MNLQVGDVFRYSGKLIIAHAINECAALVAPLTRVLHTGPAIKINGLFVKLPSPDGTFRISANSELELIARLGPDWRQKDFATEVPGFGSEPTTHPGNQETGTGMATKPTSTRKPRGGLAAEAAAANGAKRKRKASGEPKQPKPPKEGESIFGQPVRAILRRLGKEGISVEHAEAIMAAHKQKVKQDTIKFYIYAGKNGNGGQPAELTEAQLKELRTSAPEPTPVATETAK